ncbi:MAG: hypothetical protein R2867_39615 [Caldilineaceae bacterium]
MHCINLEARYGIPTASIQTAPFAPAVRSVAHVRGMPHQRFVFVPQPVMGKSPEQLRAYVDGVDPITKQPVMQEVVGALCRPLSAEETQQNRFDRSTPGFSKPIAKPTSINSSKTTAGLTTCPLCSRPRNGSRPCLRGQAANPTKLLAECVPPRPVRHGNLRSRKWPSTR